MALKVLLASHDSEFSKNLEVSLKGAGYEVTRTYNGIETQKELMASKFFHVLISYEIKNHGPFNILKFAKLNAPNVKPTMYLTESAIKALEAEQQDVEQIKNKLKQAGVFKLFAFPLEVEEIVSYIESKQNFNELSKNIIPVPENERSNDPVDMNDGEFIQIPIDHFFSTAKNLFDVYIQVGSGKYFKILHRGDQFDSSQLKRYKEDKKVEFLHIQKSDHKKYTRILGEVNRKVLNSEKVGQSSKYNITRHATSEVMKSAWTEGLSHAIVDQAQEACDNVIKLVQQDEKLYSLLRDLKDVGPEEFEHSFAVAFFSSALAKQFDWSSPITTQTLTMASLFHDIGLLKVDEMIRNKPKVEMTPEELKLYQQHPNHSVELLKNNQSISRTVLQIIGQHHECIDGNGYPHGLMNNRILMLSQILIFVNEFTDVMVDQKLTPINALKTILVNKEAFKRHNSSIVEKFSHIFIDPNLVKKKAG